jgi:hypothetical protein
MWNSADREPCCNPGPGSACPLGLPAHGQPHDCTRQTPRGRRPTPQRIDRLRAEERPSNVSPLNDIGGWMAARPTAVLEMIAISRAVISPSASGRAITVAAGVGCSSHRWRPRGRLSDPDGITRTPCAIGIHTPLLKPHRDGAGLKAHTKGASSVGRQCLESHDQTLEVVNRVYRLPSPSADRQAGDSRRASGCSWRESGRRSPQARGCGNQGTGRFVAIRASRSGGRLARRSGTDLTKTVE